MLREVSQKKDRQRKNIEYVRYNYILREQQIKKNNRTLE